MTLKGNIYSVRPTLCACLSEPITEIRMKIDPHYQRQKCSAETLVNFWYVKMYNKPYQNHLRKLLYQFLGVEELFSIH